MALLTKDFVKTPGADGLPLAVHALLEIGDELCIAHL
jgi:hypothetical protein